MNYHKLLSGLSNQINIKAKGLWLGHTDVSHLNTVCSFKWCMTSSSIGQVGIIPSNFNNNYQQQPTTTNKQPTNQPTNKQTKTVMSSHASSTFMGSSLLSNSGAMDTMIVNALSGHREPLGALAAEEAKHSDFFSQTPQSRRSVVKHSRTPSYDCS